MEKHPRGRGLSDCRGLRANILFSDGRSSEGSSVSIRAFKPVCKKRIINVAECPASLGVVFVYIVASCRLYPLSLQNYSGIAQQVKAVNYHRFNSPPPPDKIGNNKNWVDCIRLQPESPCTMECPLYLLQFPTFEFDFIVYEFQSK